MGRPPLKEKPEQKILSWRVDVSLTELLDKVMIKADDKTKVDLIERLIKEEAARLGIPLPKKKR